MHTMTAAQVTPAVMALFNATRPTIQRAFNVLEGKLQGQMWVDDLLNPKWALVRDPNYGTLYFGGVYTTAVVAMLVASVRQQDDIGISCWRDDPLNAMLLPQSDYDGSTLIFSHRSPLTCISTHAPDAYTLVTRDAYWLPQSFEYESTVMTIGSVERVLQQTLGVMVLYEHAVVCEAATGIATHGQIEIGVTTVEAHRQRGLATVACAKLIALCEAQGYATWWDCATHNSASIRLARRLGYRNEQEYRYRWWRKS